MKYKERQTSREMKRQINRLFIRKKFTSKSGSNGQNLKKFVRKSRRLNFQIKFFGWPDIDISSLLHPKY